MATNKGQRLGIIVILIATVVGTIGSFAVMILSTQNNAKLQAAYQAAYAKYQTAQTAYSKKVAAQTDELSSKYYETFKQYSDQVGTFDMSNVTAVSTEDLVVGDGEEVTGTTKLAAYYIGWDANGHVFDQSIDTSMNKLKAPLAIEDGLDNESLITGWKEGMKGMHIGGVRVITIPSDKAYGESGQKDSSGNETIAANMPLKFVVMAIPAPGAIAQPDTTELMKAYSAANGQ